jgi:polyhydroxyalkanoate synthesis regulator phasin
MSTKPQELKDKVTADFEAGKKAFHEAMTKAQGQIDTAAVEINKLRAELKTEAAEAKTKTAARVDELTKKLDATRKEQQDKIEARLKALHTEIDSVNAELKHASASEKVAIEAKAKALHAEYESTRKALTASLDAELAEWKTRIGTALDVAAEKKAEAKATIQAKLTDLHAKHEAAQKKLQALKQANAAAFGELHHGVRTAIGEVKTAVQHARADILAAS